MNIRTERLIGRYLDGTATAGEIAELDGQMKGDPEVARTLMAYSVQDVQIEGVLMEQVRPEQAFSEGSSHRRGSWFRRWGWFGAAAALMIAAILFFAVKTRTPEPRPVSTLTAVAVSSSQIDLTWTAGSDDDLSYVIERSEDGAAYARVGQQDRNDRFFTDRKLNPATVYLYRVATQMTSGRTAVSEPVRVRTRSFSIMNASAKGMVGTGEGQLNVGFIITGNASKRMFIRTRGPSLAEWGVTNPISNPFLELYSMDLMKVIGRNDDWEIPDLLGEENGYSCGGVEEIRTSTYRPPHRLDSALLITLPPGRYAAFVGAIGDATGIGIVEVFEVEE